MYQANQCVLAKPGDNPIKNTRTSVHKLVNTSLLINPCDYKYCLASFYLWVQVLRKNTAK